MESLARSCRSGDSPAEALPAWLQRVADVVLLHSDLEAHRLLPDVSVCVCVWRVCGGRAEGERWSDAAACAGERAAARRGGGAVRAVAAGAAAPRGGARAGALARARAALEPRAPRLLRRGPQRLARAAAAALARAQAARALQAAQLLAHHQRVPRRRAHRHARLLRPAARDTHLHTQEVAVLFPSARYTHALRFYNMCVRRPPGTRTS